MALQPLLSIPAWFDWRQAAWEYLRRSRKAFNPSLVRLALLNP